jgi:hypothetical protein
VLDHDLGEQLSLTTAFRMRGEVCVSAVPMEQIAPSLVFTLVNSPFFGALSSIQRVH